ncbi:MAG: hypothetical protein VX940_07350 [Pseudomonadota bacterium]|nr:hypothetical protein [Pseudomonadota bacterium]
MNMAVLERPVLGNARGAALTGVRAPRSGRLAVGVLDLIEWAFQREKVGLDFDEIERETGARPGIGMEYLMMQQAQLGCRVQGGGTSPRHHDADMVAASLACLPEIYGGRRMAVQIAELARVGERPDCLMDAEQRCAPLDWRGTKHGRFAVVEVCRVPGLRWPADQLGKRADGSWCPVGYSVTGREIAAARRRYLSWYGALLHLRHIFQAACHLTSFVVTEAMPPRTPWQRG